MTPAELVGCGPGCAVWDLAGHEDPETIRGPHGGIVYAVDRQADEETGEIVDVFLWVEPWRETYRVGSMPAGDVRQWSLPNSASVRSMVRRLCAVVFRSKGPLDSFELAAVELAYHLTHIERQAA